MRNDLIRQKSGAVEFKMTPQKEAEIKNINKSNGMVKKIHELERRIELLESVLRQ